MITLNNKTYKLPILSVHDLRSPLKIANHRTILNKKLLLGRQLKIFPAKYSSNWKIIEDLRHGLCDADKVIHCLASDLNLQIEEVRQMILGITVSPQLEIHTTDRCALFF